MRLGWGITGCGDITNKRVAPAIHEQENSDLISFFSRDLERAEDFATRHGARRFCSSLEELVADPEVGAVYVASPPDRHCRETVVAAEHGKHVLCEKPMALDPDQCQQMIDACARNHVNLAIAYYRRYYPKARKMRELIAGGAIGKPVRANIMMTGTYDPPPGDVKGWRVREAVSGGGALMDVGSHRLDVICYLLGEPTEVYGFADRLAMRYEVPDTETVLARFADGAHVVACLNWNMPTGRDDLEVHGTEGSLVASPFDGDELRLIAGGKEERFYVPHAANVHFPLIDDFVRRTLAGQPPEFSGEDGLKTTQIINAAYESSRAGKRVSIVPARSAVGEGGTRPRCSPAR